MSNLKDHIVDVDMDEGVIYHQGRQYYPAVTSSSPSSPLLRLIKSEESAGELGEEYLEKYKYVKNLGERTCKAVFMEETPTVREKTERDYEEPTLVNYVEVSGVLVLLEEGKLLEYPNFSLWMSDDYYSFNVLKLV